MTTINRRKTTKGRPSNSTVLRQKVKAPPTDPQAEGVKLRLQARKVEFEPSRKRDRLEDLLKRSKRGMLAYTNCGASELETCRKGRGIELGSLTRSKGEYKEHLIDLLEKADDAPHFIHFLKLPPELRVRIYGELVTHRENEPTEDNELTLPVNPLERQSFGGIVQDSWQSALQGLAIAQTNSQIRKEALPIFYARNTFVFDTMRGERWNDETTQMRRDLLKLWGLDVVGLPNLSRISSLEIGLVNLNCEGGGKCYNMHIRITFGVRGLRVTHLDAEVPPWTPCQDCDAEKTAAEEITTVCEKYGGRGEDDGGAPKLNRRLVEELLGLCSRTEWSSEAIGSE